MSGIKPLSVAQLRQLMQLESQYGDIVLLTDELLASKPGARDEIAAKVIPWAGYYDDTVERQLEGVVRAFGLTGELQQSISSKDPHQFLLDYASNDDDDSSPFTPERRDALIGVLGLYYGIARNFDSLRVFGKYLNELVAAGRDGDDKSFFDAIRIDPTVVTTEAFKLRLSRAVVENKAAFFERLQRALKGKTEKHKSQLNRVRFAIRAVLELGGLELKDHELRRLFVEQLNLYPGSGAAATVIRKEIRKQEKSRTQKRRS